MAKKLPNKSEAPTATRGEYRAIYTVLWNGPDWQQLPPNARLVWLALKGNCGPTGLACLPATAHQVSRWTGLDVPAVTNALAVLVTSGWILSEGDVVWVRGGIQHDPLYHPSNDNHRKAALRYVAGMPRLAIVGAFVRAHPEWFPPSDVQPVMAWALTPPDAEPARVGPSRVPDTMGDGIPDGISIPSPIPPRSLSTENGVLLPTTNVVGTAEPAVDGWDANWAAQIAEFVRLKCGALVEIPRIGRVAKTARGLYDWPTFRDALLEYDCHRSARQRPFALEHFVADLPGIVQLLPLPDDHPKRGRYRDGRAVA